MFMFPHNYSFGAILTGLKSTKQRDSVRVKEKSSTSNRNRTIKTRKTWKLLIFQKSTMSKFFLVLMAFQH